MAKGKSGGGNKGGGGERTGPTPASLAGRGLAGEKLTPAQQKTVYASALTQAPNKPTKK
jgi:hypothetical protein